MEKGFKINGETVSGAVYAEFCEVYGKYQHLEIENRNLKAIAKIALQAGRSLIEAQKLVTKEV